VAWDSVLPTITEQNALNTFFRETLLSSVEEPLTDFGIVSAQPVASALAPSAESLFSQPL